MLSVGQTGSFWQQKTLQALSPRWLISLQGFFPTGISVYNATSNFSGTKHFTHHHTDDKSATYSTARQNAQAKACLVCDVRDSDIWGKAELSNTKGDNHQYRQM